MGRRSINTTKSGRFMNPTDQARKEARKRELKKNKKQRTAVRQAVLKAKDPMQLLEEAAFYDKQEYDPACQTTLTERVIQEKRRKLLETFDRLAILYRKEEPETATALAKARTDYEQKRHEMMLYYEQVKLAERVTADEIPLPDQMPGSLNPSDIPLPPSMPSSAPSSTTAKGILKSTSYTAGILLLPPPPANKKPAGPPPGPVPELSDSEDELIPPATEVAVDNRTRKIRFSDEKLDNNLTSAPPRFPPTLAQPPPGISFSRADREKMEAILSGDLVIDDAEIGYAPSSLPPLPHVGGPPETMPFTPSAALKPLSSSSSLSSLRPPPPMSLSSIPMPSMLPPMPRPPMMPPPLGLPPPPHHLPSRIPMPPPPPPPPPPSTSSTFLSSNPILTAPPNVKKPVDAAAAAQAMSETYTTRTAAPGVGGSSATASSSSSLHQMSVIEAKPKLKNFIGDATKFVPTALKIKRTVKDNRGKLVTIGGGSSSHDGKSGKDGLSAMYNNTSHAVAASKDDAYDAFMKEMDGLL